MTICARCGKQNSARDRYCGRCGTPLALLPAREVRKVVTVLLCDLVDSTAMAERLDAEAFRRILSRYYAEMKEAVERHGGRVAKNIGDAILGVFGHPTLHEDDALRAVSAAAEMRDRLVELNRELKQDWGTEIRTRIGVNTGEVVVDVVLSDFDPFVGDTVNVAARLEQAAGAGEILLGDRTHAFVRDSVETVAVEPMTLKGKSEPVLAWRLLQVTAPHGRLREFDAPLIGRQRELAWLTAELARTEREGTTQLVTILGPAGIGKSRLIHEFVASLDGRFTVLQGRCVPYGDGVTFWPIAEVIRQACGIAADDSAAESRRKLTERLPASEIREVVGERLAVVVGLGGTESQTTETFWAIRKLLEELAQPQPLVIVFDDVHWAEDTFIAMVEDLSLRAQGPILLLCLARPELFEQGAAWTAEVANARLLRLDPLDQREGALLLASLLCGGELEARAESRLIEAASGNPLFLEELVHMLVDERLLRKEGELWSATTDLSSIAVPPSLRALLGARLDRLEPQARLVVETASVIGGDFTRSALCELLPPAVRGGISALLDTLFDRGLIRDGRIADELRFHHILSRDVAYESMPKRTRAELHSRYAVLLEEQVGDRLPEHEEIVGYHFEQAFRLREQLGPIGPETRALAVRAGTHLSSSGRRASGRGDIPGALHLLRRALALLPDEAAGSNQAMLDLGVSMMQTGDAVAADELLTRAIDLAAAHGDQRLEWHARIERSGLRVDVRPELGWESLRAEAEEALAVFEAVGDEAGLAKAARRLATIDGVACRWGAAGAGFERARAHARHADDAREEALASAMIFHCLVLGPTRVDIGIDRCGELLREAGKHRSVEAVGLAALANLQAMVGRFVDARRLLARSEVILEDLGQTRRLVETSFRAAETEMLAGDPDAAERKLAWAYRTVEPTGQRGYLASIAAALAEPLEALGRYDEALEMTRISEAAAGEDDPDSQVKWRQVRAKICAVRGDVDAAALYAREAVQRAAATDAVNMQASALTDLAGVLELVGLHVEGRRTARAALDLYLRKQNRVGSERTQALLARLQPRRAGVRESGT
jgi:class 3 adenylate cyclase/tetratricopeptide (TPR) repeat protein